MFYSWARKVFFLFDAEAVHHFVMGALRFICDFAPIRSLLERTFSKTGDLSTTVWGIRFPNPVGLAAGFDKNAQYLRELQTLGFGFIEIGTVTPLAQEGNDRPRMFRLPKDKALINRMGFNNDGAKTVALRLATWRDQEKTNARSKYLIIGGNIGKNKSTPNEDAWKDYEICFNELFDFVDYFVVNVSSPNTPGLRALQEKSSLEKILRHLNTLNTTRTSPKPILLKIAPDLNEDQLNDVVELAREVNLDGLVIANTTISRDGLKTSDAYVKKIGAGGLSGQPLAQRSTAMIQHVSEKTKGQLPIIASGGIFTASDAKEKLNAGATLVQVWTGFIYEGPGIVKNICKNGL
jgi:dihydroorotate dehydrogenase